MISNIIILTGPIISGKTTVLGDLVKNLRSVRGFLTPDVNQRRQVQILPLGSHPNIPMQAQEPGENTLSIGRYHFYSEAFVAMKNELTDIADHPAEWNIVDELGKLELKEKGLCPELDHVIQKCKKPGQAGRLMLVIRDELLELAVEKYGLEQAIVIQKEDAELVF